MWLRAIHDVQLANTTKKLNDLQAQKHLHATAVTTYRHNRSIAKNNSKSSVTGLNLLHSLQLTSTAATAPKETPTTPTEWRQKHGQRATTISTRFPAPSQLWGLLSGLEFKLCRSKPLRPRSRSPSLYGLGLSFELFEFGFPVSSLGQFEASKPTSKGTSEQTGWVIKSRVRTQVHVCRRKP